MNKIITALVLLVFLTAHAQPASQGIEACPYLSAQAKAQSKAKSQTSKGKMEAKEWWPNQLNLDILRQNADKSNPMGEDFNYI